MAELLRASDPNGLQLVREPFVPDAELLAIAERAVSSTLAIASPSVQLLSPLYSGSRHQVQQVHQRPDLAIRLRNPRIAPDDYAPVEKLVSDRAIQVGVPIMAILTGSHILPPEVGGERAFTLVEFVRGKRLLNLLETEQPEVADQAVRQLAVTLAKLHAMRPDGGYGFFDTRQAKEAGQLVGVHQTYQTRLLDGLGKCLDTLVTNKYLDIEQARSLQEYFTDSDIAKEVCAEPAVILHGDCGPHSLVINESGDTSRGVLIDLEETQAGPVVHDLAIACNFIDYALDNFRRDDIDNHAIISSFLESYQTAGGVVPENLTAQLQFMRRRAAVGSAALHAVQISRIPGDTPLIKSVKRRLAVIKREELLDITLPQS